MPRDVSTENIQRKKDITWNELIKDSETEILACLKKIAELRKSLRFFKKQADMGIHFPKPEINRHK